MAGNEGRNLGLSIFVGICAVIGVIYAFAHFAMEKGIGPGPGDTLLQWIALLVIFGIIFALVKLNQK